MPARHTGPPAEAGHCGVPPGIVSGDLPAQSPFRGKPEDLLERLSYEPGGVTIWDGEGRWGGWLVVRLSRTGGGFRRGWPRVIPPSGPSPTSAGQHWSTASARWP